MRYAAPTNRSQEAATMFNFNTKCQQCSLVVRVNRANSIVLSNKGLVASLVDPGRPANLKVDPKRGVAGVQFGAATVTWVCTCGATNSHEVPARLVP